MMGKSFIIGMSALLLLGSCDTYTGTGAYMGSTLGSIFGSAIGGIAGGPHGDNRIYDFKGSDYSGNYSARQPDVNMPMQSGVENLVGDLRYTPDIEIRNARFVDDNQDGKIERGER